MSRRALILWSLLSVVSWPAHASARVLMEERAGAWTVTARADDRSGAFTLCSGAIQGRDGVGLALSLDRQSRWSMAFTGNLGGNPGDSHPVRYRVDRGPTRTGTASVEPDGVVRVALDEAASFLDEIRRGGVLTADAGAERLTFSLRDTRVLVGRLAACVEGQTRTAQAGGGTGRMSDASVTGSSAAVPNAERRLEAMTVAVNILSRAKVTGFDLQPKQVPPQFSGHDVVWQSGDVSGSLRLVPMAAGASLGTIRADLVSSDIRGCEGRFTAEASPGSEAASAGLLTVCQGDKGQAADYLAMPRPTGGAYVLSLVGPSDKTEAVKSAATSLREAAVQVTSVPR